MPLQNACYFWYFCLFMYLPYLSLLVQLFSCLALLCTLSWSFCCPESFCLFGLSHHLFLSVLTVTSFKNPPCLAWLYYTSIPLSKYNFGVNPCEVRLCPLQGFYPVIFHNAYCFCPSIPFHTHRLVPLLDVSSFFILSLALALSGYFRIIVLHVVEAFSILVLLILVVLLAR